MAHVVRNTTSPTTLHGDGWIVCSTTAAGYRHAMHWPHALPLHRLVERKKDGKKDEKVERCTLKEMHPYSDTFCGTFHVNSKEPVGVSGSVSHAACSSRPMSRTVSGCYWSFTMFRVCCCVLNCANSYNNCPPGTKLFSFFVATTLQRPARMLDPQRTPCEASDPGHVYKARVVTSSTWVYAPSKLVDIFTVLTVPSGSQQSGLASAV